MLKVLNNLLIFVSGFVIGVIAANKILAKKHEDILKEEIDSIKNEDCQAEQRYPTTKDKIKVDPIEDEEKNIHYVILPDEFGEKDGYETISLTYYFQDAILADEDDEIIENVEETVGEESLKHFGEYDCVYVRNDVKKCDYEILLDLRNYEEVTKDGPPKVGV